MKVLSRLGWVLRTQKRQKLKISWCVWLWSTLSLLKWLPSENAGDRTSDGSRNIFIRRNWIFILLVFKIVGQKSTLYESYNMTHIVVKLFVWYKLLLALFEELIAVLLAFFSFQRLMLIIQWSNKVTVPSGLLWIVFETWCAYILRFFALLAVFNSSF